MFVFFVKCIGNVIFVMLMVVFFVFLIFWFFGDLVELMVNESVI